MFTFESVETAFIYSAKASNCKYGTMLLVPLTFDPDPIAPY